jgi:hypothetical protein
VSPGKQFGSTVENTTASFSVNPDDVIAIVLVDVCTLDGVKLIASGAVGVV